MEGVLIDPAVYDDSIVLFIKKHKIAVNFIINTHGHFDHIGGNKYFGYPILIHEDDKQCLNDPLRNLGFAEGGDSVEPNIKRLLKDKDEIKIKNISFKVIHTPGHTPGSICLECGKIIFTGDTLFNEGVGRTDIPYADDNDLKKSLKKLMVYSDDAVCYPGHGPSTTIGHERRCNPFIR